MGAILPKPVESCIIERHNAKAFRIGIAEVNGWRNNMEDAHLIHTCADWACFGVFDGHGGDKCSAFVARRLAEELQRHGCPQDDADVKKLLLRIDAEFLATGQPGGSTGAMCIVHRPTRGGKFRIRLANVGDSRVLLSRRDGTLVDGGGTDGSLTTDHKPDHPSERQRIYRCGGHVEEGEGGGPARVNGELSVSRCFGDSSHKQTGGPGPEDHPVTANPELGEFECDESNFIVIVCDGISEGNFPNAEVVKMIATNLHKDGDLGAAARAACHKAIAANSKDNVTCMIVQLSGGGTDEAKSVEFIPGPLSSCNHKAFMTAWEAMAKKAGLSLAEAAEMRYENIMEELATPHANTRELRAEVEGIQSGLGAPAGSKGSAERRAWFRTWEQKLPDKMTNDEGDPDMLLLRMVAARSGMLPGMLGGGPLSSGAGAPGGMDSLGSLGGLLGGTGGLSGVAAPLEQAGRRVRLPETAVLKKAVNEHPALEWDARMAKLVSAEGEVEMDDPSDHTSRVCFSSLKVTAWLPTSVLIPINGSERGNTPCRRPSASAPAHAAGTPSGGSRAGRSSLPGSRPRSDPSTASNGTGAMRRGLAPRGGALGASMGVGQAPSVSGGVSAALNRERGARNASTHLSAPSSAAGRRRNPSPNSVL